ncbi:hypothetical protein M2163_007770 [Streptomyces sp. SAI-135]|nr:hypothetical protein [Streptomyces sp. SAI-090]MDH6620662.1 hypothetical protein [Streptomyces sp. SAI-135]
MRSSPRQPSQRGPNGTRRARPGHHRTSRTPAVVSHRPGSRDRHRIDRARAAGAAPPSHTVRTAPAGPMRSSPRQPSQHGPNGTRRARPGHHRTSRTPAVVSHRPGSRDRDRMDRARAAGALPAQPPRSKPPPAGPFAVGTASAEPTRRERHKPRRRGRSPTGRAPESHRTTPAAPARAKPTRRSLAARAVSDGPARRARHQPSPYGRGRTSRTAARTPTSHTRTVGAAPARPRTVGAGQPAHSEPRRGQSVGVRAASVP